MNRPNINFHSASRHFTFANIRQYSIIQSHFLHKMAATFPVAIDPSMPSSNGRVKRPREFTCFSYDKDHKFRLDDSSLKWYYPPQGPFLDAGMDLSRGFETFDKHDDSVDEHLDSLLKTIAHFEQQTQEPIDANIVTWRGMMTKIMAAPFDDEGFEMNATLYRGCVFIEENHAFKLKRNAEQSSRPQQHQQQRKGPPPEVMSFWGYKFETLCTLPRPWGEVSRDYIESRDSLVVSNKDQYCSVVRTGVDDSILCLGGEVDCLWGTRPSPPDEKGAPINWVELKTTAEFRGKQDELWFKNKKMMKFWIQSYLLGVPKIVFGFRDRNGILKRIEEMETMQLPRIARNARCQWSADGCINFMSSFLAWLRVTVNDDGVWRIRRQKGASEIEVWRVEEAGHGEVLTEEFMNWRIKLDLIMEGKKKSTEEGGTLEQAAKGS
ncbi:RAI1 like PD-XK nuclease-domain-containing protein [Cladorrhinum sp. PSN259]|nr:RAI1 like PD-XK nuclease-domain-containing protein [Cladorrhinum sp. PSN259]